ncbi:SulP family inorganic anion transporter, partial [Rhodococcus rhodochrous]
MTGSSALPGIATARAYRREWLRPDITAGLVLTALLIPAGMGYAEAAGLPAYAGLYATIVPLLAYAVVGPSKILVLGPDSSLAPLIAAAVLPLAVANDPESALVFAGVLGVLVGVILLVGGFLRLGFVTELLSKPIRLGYLNAIALVVIVGQLP